MDLEGYKKGVINIWNCFVYKNAFDFYKHFNHLNILLLYLCDKTHHFFFIRSAFQCYNDKIT